MLACVICPAHFLNTVYSRWEQYGANVRIVSLGHMTFPKQQEADSISKIHYLRS